MSYAVFWGCKIPYYAPAYELAASAVLDKLDVAATEVEFGCCGYPVRHLDFMAFVISAAKNFALAKAKGLDILTPCKCCFGTLKAAARILDGEPSLAREVSERLAEEGLSYDGPVRIRHLLQVLHHEVGPQSLWEQTVRPYRGLNLAVHYGCHALRPSAVTLFDHPADPSLFEDLIAATGAKTVDWSERLECCGNPLWGRNDELSLKITARKIDSARKAGADFICLACTYCHIQFDQVQERLIAQRGGEALPAILYPQLLGLALGLEPERVGLDKNRLGGERVVDFLEENNGPEANQDPPPAKDDN